MLPPLSISLLMLAPSAALAIHALSQLPNVHPRFASRSLTHGAFRCLATGDVAHERISPESPLKVLIAGAGVGGLALANCLELSGKPVEYTILERTKEFKKFGGPIQLASNAMQSFRNVDLELYDEIASYATWTGNRTNGIKVRRLKSMHL